MIKAIRARLKTGSIPAVYVRGNRSTSAENFYVVFWLERAPDDPSGKIVDGVRVSVHGPVGYRDTIENYIINEVVTLLHKVPLVDSFGNDFMLWRTQNYSNLIEENDDKTISIDRLFEVPCVNFG